MDTQNVFIANKKKRELCTKNTVHNCIKLSNGLKKSNSHCDGAKNCNDSKISIKIPKRMRRLCW
ncbi:hypothetical protein HZS_5803 [Henneguya salminicola]|nr:hypothetical protein HZS_5803 [Henneguya salminicola]